MKKYSGFALIQALLILIVLGLVGGTAWYVYQSNNKVSDTYSNADSANSSVADYSKIKEYKNDEYGFSFQYPENWELAINLKDGGRGNNEGEVYVSSPKGTKVYFNPNLGGKGGDCVDDSGNRTAESCDTLETLSVEKIGSFGSKEIYLYKTNFKPLAAYVAQGSKGGYSLYIDDEPNKVRIGAYAGTNVGRITTSTGGINIYIEGVDNTSEKYFENTEVKAAEKIFRSFMLH